MSAPVDTSGSSRRFWVVLGVSAIVLVVLVALACGLLWFLLRDRVAGLLGDPVGSWEDAATGATTITVYRPGYLPPGTGEPFLSISHPVEGVEEVRAWYATGLAIVQSNAALQAEDPREHEPVSLESAGEAYFVSAPIRTLVVHKGGTWVTVEGVPDPELVRIVESLEPVNLAPVPSLSR